MRTNIVLNDDLVREAMRYSRARSKSALVEEALRVYVQTCESHERRKRYAVQSRRIAQALQNKVFRQSGADILREDRERE